MIKMKRIKGQNLIEYSVFIFCLVAAVIAMQVYIKRSVQGRLRSSADDVGEQFDAKRTSGSVTYSVSGKTITNTQLSRVGCTADQGSCVGVQPSDCIQGPDGNYYLDLNCDGHIDDSDYVSASDTSLGEYSPDLHQYIFPETTVRSGYEETGPFGDLYE